jgi:hypothetical protein
MKKSEHKTKRCTHATHGKECDGKNRKNEKLSGLYKGKILYDRKADIFNLSL